MILIRICNTCVGFELETDIETVYNQRKVVVILLVRT